MSSILYYSKFCEHSNKLLQTLSKTTQKDIHFIFQEGPMQKIACDALGLHYEELMPLINTSSKHAFNRKKKYVCISVHSTSQMKYWNNGVGWQKVIRYLKKLNYK